MSHRRTESSQQDLRGISQGKSCCAGHLAYSNADTVPEFGDNREPDPVGKQGGYAHCILDTHREHLLPDATDPPLFTQGYSLWSNNYGLLLDDVKGPVTRDFTSYPKNSNPHYSFFVTTVRDPRTLRVITENGYGRMYSVEKSKKIVLYSAGRYHINLYGNLMDVTISITTGDSPVEDSVVPVATIRAEEEMWA